MNIPLNIDLQQILLHLCNFVILAGGLYFLLYKPVKNFMDKRLAGYQAMEDQAREKEKHAEALEAEYRKRLDEAETEIDAKKAQAARDAEKLAALTLDEARKQKEQILEEARQAAAAEKEKAVREGKEEIVQLALAATEKMLRGQEASHG